MAVYGKFTYEKLVSHTFPVEQDIEGFELGVKKQAIKVLVKP
ncbi:hypothetical protein [Bacillus sp. V5-8f]|nr:hypothetical protein [Bacillus sp. V5-8f]